MPRRAEGWKLKCDPRTGIQSVRFRHQGKRYDLSTGRRDPEEASEEAKRLYSEVVSGRYRPHLVTVARLEPAKPGTPLDVSAAEWLADLGADHDETTVETYGGYVRAHWQPFFKSLDQMITPRIDEYRLARLRVVKAGTVRKELSAMRSFLKWCEDHNRIREMPLVRGVPKRVTGTADTKRPHKAGPIELVPKEVGAMLAALPEWSKGKGKKRFRVRAAMIVTYETGLRAETIRSLIGADVVRGKLRIRDEADKARFGRTVPLSKRARAELERIGARDLEPIFGHHDYRPYIEPACVKAKIARISPHDLRHACAQHMLDTTADIRGAAYVLGHKRVTTMDIYARPTQKAAERAMAKHDKKRAGKRG